MNNKLIILIPAYEPTKDFIQLLKDIKKSSITTIVVNDGSNSKYDEIFESASKYAKVLKYEINQGKGIALKTGIKYIDDTFKENYTIITMDCDGQHTIKDALKLGEYSINNPSELVSGKRLRDKKIPLRSKIGNSITKFVFKAITKLDIYDTQSGLRAFSKELVPLMLSTTGDRYEYEMNILLNCSKNKIKITELPIETIYIDNNSNSHFKTIKDSFKIYKRLAYFMINKKI